MVDINSNVLDERVWSAGWLMYHKEKIMRFIYSIKKGGKPCGVKVNSSERTIS